MVQLVILILSLLSNIDWIEFSSNFISNLGFEPNLMTTQIESHDGYVKLFSSIAN